MTKEGHPFPQQQPERVVVSYDEVYARESDPIAQLQTDRWPRNRWEAVVHVFPAKADRVLEIGCGNGTVLHHIACRCREMIGLELSGNRARHAERNLADARGIVEIRQENIERGIDIEDGHFDVIVWTDAIEHVIDLFGAMQEVERLLKRGRALITSTLNVGYLPNRLKLLLGNFPSTSAPDEGFRVRQGEMYDGGHMHYFTYGALKKLHQMFGLRPVRTIGFGRRLSLARNLWPPLLSGAVLLVGEKT